MIEILYTSTKEKKDERLFFDEKVEEQKNASAEVWKAKKAEADAGTITGLLCICSNNHVIVYNPPEKLLATVAFKVYDYVVPSHVDGKEVKKGDYIKVISGSNLVELKILDLHSTKDKKKGVDYVAAEEVVFRR